ncbi:hypothetical protein ACH35V_20905 [Actinomadura sp. 1N219]
MSELAEGRARRAARTEVWDDGDGCPEVQPEDHTATSGRGLLMVSLLA